MIREKRIKRGGRLPLVTSLGLAVNKEVSFVPRAFHVLMNYDRRVKERERENTAQKIRPGMNKLVFSNSRGVPGLNGRKLPMCQGREREKETRI